MTVHRNPWLFGIGALFGLICVAQLPAAEKTPDAKPKSGIDRTNFDESVKPGDNFFEYVNGNWIRHNPIPAEYSRWGSFSQLHDDNLVHLREIVEGLAKESGPLDENRRKIRDFYATAMDEAKLEKVGVEPLKDELDRIAAIKNRDDLITEVGRLHATGIGALFGVHVAQDEKQSSRYIVYLHQGGLSLPEREYYVGTSDYYKKIREQYTEHNAKMLGMLGHRPDKTSALANQVLALETKLAEASKSPVQLRDREANYNKYSLADLAKLTPNLNWDLFWKAAGIGKLDAVIVGQPDFIKRVNELLESAPIDQWRVYLRWHLIHSTAPYLNDAIERENFHFYSETLRGTKE
ncbi:MAG TPA: M13 family metallopeptidase N-terminal domain-containing protein, partial [Pirellulales bacterium]|nr:M13 family metallopeptidase N-terminal domain-containing protein [Pirellulales bacterium]